MVDPNDLSYMAGFFDGEGTVGIKFIKSSRKVPLHSPYVTVSQVTPGVLRWMREYFGGSIYLKPPSAKGQGIWCWQLSQRLAINFLKEIQPYLRIKKAEAELVIEAFQERVVNKRAGVP